MKKNTLLEWKSVWLAAMCLWLSVVGCHESLGREVRVGVYDNPPKVSVSGRGEADGFFIDILKEVARSEGWKLVFVAGSWDEGLRQLEAGEIDLMPDVAFSPERAERFNLGQVPVLSDWFEVYGREGNPIRSWEELRGKRISVLGSSIQELVFRRELQALQLDFTLVPTADHYEVFHFLQSGKADAGVTNRFFGLRYRDIYNIDAESLIFYPTSLVFAAPKGRNRELLAKIDVHVSRMRAERGSAYYRFLEKWIQENPAGKWPAWVWPVFTGVWVFAGVLLLFVVVLRRQVAYRTRELEEKSQRLEEALSELKLAQVAALKQERFNALGQMASGVAHDFNNSLSTIAGYTDILLMRPENLKDPVKVGRRLEIVRKATRDAAQIVARLRSFYQERHPEKKNGVVDLGEMVKDAIDLTHPRWSAQARANRKTVQVDSEIEANVCVWANAGDLREILVNLIFNAVDAIEGKGTISLRVKSLDNVGLLEVEDSGCGMSPEVQQKCQEPFYTTKGEDGTGMGLAIVRTLIEEHKGELLIRSEAGCGTCFTIRLPLYAGSQQGKDAMVEELVYLPDAFNVLVVDADESALRTTAGVLSDAGATISSAQDAEDALTKLETTSFNLLLCDVALPGQTAFALAEIVTREWPAVQLVFLRDTSEELDATAIPSAKETVVISKPLRLKALQELLKKGGRW